MPFFVERHIEDEECPSENEPYHVYYARDFAETQIELFEAHEIGELLKLKESIEKYLLKIQETVPDPYVHEDAPWRDHGSKN
tara:strand:- start:4032 stop:4277 length:246 start_codon:yes stop_codon:yes gene_type:complete